MDVDPTYQNTWRKPLITICCVVLAAAACFEAYRRLANYGASRVEAQPVEARIEICNPPTWLDRGIVQNLLGEAYKFAQRDVATYNRARNIQDAEVLREIADLYTGDGEKQANGYNAWIKSISQVRREVAKDKSGQTIQIVAEWRKPFAWVLANDRLYLIDEEGTRLPGEYRRNERGGKLMVISGVDLPLIDGVIGVPAPGGSWSPGGRGAPSGDLLAAMKLTQTLQTRQFVRQIDTIDLTNFEGRKDARAPWIMLNTIWRTADGRPRVVHWGRSIGREEFYEVHAATKLKSLDQLYVRFGRIDSDRDYVDIRDEVLRRPQPPTPEETRGRGGQLAGAQPAR